MGFPNGSSGKESACNAGDTGDAASIPGSRRSLGGENGNPLQYSCLENPMNRGAWWATVYGVAKSWTWLSIYITIIPSCPKSFIGIQWQGWKSLPKAGLAHNMLHNLLSPSSPTSSMIHSGDSITQPKVSVLFPQPPNQELPQFSCMCCWLSPMFCLL